MPNTGADIALAIEQSVRVLEQPALQAEDVADPVGQGHLGAHDAGQVLQQLLKCSKLFVVHGNHGPLEELVAVDEEFDLFGPLLAGDLDEGGAVGAAEQETRSYRS